MGANVPVRRLVVKVLKAANLSLAELAKAAGISVHAIRMYRKGLRTPPPRVVRRLAVALRRHARRLAKLADALETTAQAPTRTGRRP